MGYFEIINVHICTCICLLCVAGQYMFYFCSWDNLTKNGTLVVISAQIINQTFEDLRVDLGITVSSGKDGLNLLDVCC
jgi:hypothetical protein